MELTVENAVALLMIMYLVWEAYKIFFRSEDTHFEGLSGTGRELGNIELLLSQSQARGLSNVCVVLTIKTKKSLSKQDIHLALESLARRQPVLRAAIVQQHHEGKTKKIFNLVDAKDAVVFTQSEVTAGDWQKVWRDFVCTRFSNLKEPLWRTMMLQEEHLADTNSYRNTFLFVFGHSIMDGVSSMRFSHQFMQNLNEIMKGNQPYHGNVNSFQMSPSLDKLTSHIGGWSQWQRLLGLPRLWSMLLKRLIPFVMKLRKPNPFFATFPPTFNSQSQPKVIVREFTVDETTQLVKACKANGCTVHGALVVASNIAFCEVVKRGHTKLTGPLHSLTTVNTLRDCQPKPDEEYVGMFVTGLPMALPVLTRYVDFWSWAKKITVDIHSGLKKGRHVKDFLGAINALNPLESFNDMIIPEDRDLFVRMATCNAMSNIGRFEMGTEEDYILEVERCMFTSTAHRYPGVFGHFIGTVNNKLSWMICFDDGLVQEKQGRIFADICFEMIDKNVED